MLPPTPMRTILLTAMFLLFTRTAYAAESVSSLAAPDVIAVEGTVLKTQSRWLGDSRMLVTEVTLNIKQASTSHVSGTLTFTAPGGELPKSNLQVTVNSVPLFRAGQTITVSLNVLSPEAIASGSPSPDAPDRYSYRTHLPTTGADA